MQTAVHINGKINDSAHIDSGWTVELAFPWSGMKWLANNRSLPFTSQKNKDEWKFQFSRFEKLDFLNKAIGWSWEPIGLEDNHIPEKFTTIELSKTYIEDL